MSGPLTPPPTSATELMDQERDGDAPPVAAPETEVAPGAEPGAAAPTADTEPATAPEEAPMPAEPTLVQNYYQQHLVTLADLVATGSWDEVIRIAELADLNPAGEDRAARLSLLVPLVLAYLIKDELPPARSVFTRVHANIAAQPLAQSLFNLFAAAWERKYERVYVRAEELYALVKRPEFEDQNLSAVTVIMLNGFITAFRQRAVALVSKAYSSIPLTLAQGYLGLSAEACISELGARGWTFDSATKVLSHAPTNSKATPARAKGTLANSSSLATFDFIATTTAKLEV